MSIVVATQVNTIEWSCWRIDEMALYMASSSDKDVQVLLEAAALGFGQKLKRED